MLSGIGNGSEPKRSRWSWDVCLWWGGGRDRGRGERGRGKRGFPGSACVVIS